LRRDTGVFNCSVFVFVDEEKFTDPMLDGDEEWKFGGFEEVGFRKRDAPP
jgi:hypothetical protein